MVYNKNVQLANKNYEETEIFILSFNLNAILLNK